jgi:hypothetical protein
MLYLSKKASIHLYEAILHEMNHEVCNLYDRYRDLA